MCLSIPAKIEEIDGDMALVSVGDTHYNASLQMLEDVQCGEYVLIHAGFAIQKISPEEAEETLNTFREFEQFNQDLDELEQMNGTRIT